MKIRKNSLAYFFLVFALSLFLGTTNDARADHKDTEPELKNVHSVGRNSVVLPIEFDEFKREHVIVRVKIKNRNTGQEMHQHKVVELDKDGEANVTVTGLNPNSRYSFKVKIMDDDGGDFSKYSDSEKATTLA